MPDRYPDHSVGAAQGINQAAQCVGAIFIAPLIKRWPTRSVLATSIMFFSLMTAILLVVDASTGMGFSSYHRRSVNLGLSQVERLGLTLRTTRFTTVTGIQMLYVVTRHSDLYPRLTECRRSLPFGLSAASLTVWSSSSVASCKPTPFFFGHSLIPPLQPV